MDKMAKELCKKKKMQSWRNFLSGMNGLKKIGTPGPDTLELLLKLAFQPP